MADTGCMSRCCRCLVSVPCSALMCWLMTTVSVAACGGALMVAVRRTNELLDYTEIFSHADVICLGVIFGMVIMATIFLIAATFTSRPLNRNFLSSSKKTDCVKAWLVLEILLLLILLLGWFGVCLLLTYPIAVYVIVWVLYHQTENCIDLHHYLLSPTSKEICGGALKMFYEESEGVFECYTIALAGALLTLISLVFFLMYISANYIQIQEASPTEYSIYKNDIVGHKPSGGSVLDTRM